MKIKYQRMVNGIVDISDYVVAHTVESFDSSSAAAQWIENWFAWKKQVIEALLQDAAKITEINNTGITWMINGVVLEETMIIE